MHDVSRRMALGGMLALAVVAPAAVAKEPVPLAIKGYDPVAYFTLGRPAPGLPELEFEWDEQRYRFASAEHQKMFQADPTRYAPQFSGVCVIALTRGEVDQANPEYWLVSDGKLYLFGKPVGPSLFQKDVAENLAKANRHRPLVLKQ